MTAQPRPGPYLGGQAQRIQHHFPDYFADADASFGEARFVIFGLPYDQTVSYRFGARLGPRAIRQAAWNLERYNVRNGVNAADVPVHDMGDLALADLAPDKMVATVHERAREIVTAGKFPVALGGEHSTIPPVIEALKSRYADLGVLQIDAHLDYRDQFEDSPHNHACAMRRAADVVGPERVVGIGIRSVEEAELQEARRDGLAFHTSFDVRRRGISAVVNDALRALDTPHVYLTIDVDGIDPAYAPATGTPEPFGLTPFEVLDVIQRTAPRLVGFDVNEVAPAWDAGNTASLAARLVRETITEVWGNPA